MGHSYKLACAGRQEKSWDNRNVETRKTYDALGRVTQVVENYDNGVGETDTDKDRTTQYTFDTSGRLSQIRAKNPKGSGNGVEDQDTTYVYGTSATDATPEVCRNDRLAAIIYPDSDDTYTPGSGFNDGGDGYDRVELTYDRQGRILTRKDQRGTVHSLT